MKNNGFTLIEILISLVIIFILSATLLSFSGRQSKRLELRLQAFLLAQQLRELEERALSGEDVNCSGANKNFCGFGINIENNKNSYKIFADCANDCSSSNFRFTGTDDVLLETIFLKNIETCFSEAGSIDITFAPPYPFVYINSVKWGNEIQLKICLSSDLNQTKTIKVNNAGNIEIQ